jgi:putative serine protease PepD
VSDSPEDPEAEEPDPGDGSVHPDDDESRQRGWIDPDDRIWRHPSEMAPDRVTGPVLLNAPPRHARRGAVMVGVGVVAVMAVVAWVVVLLSPASEHPPTSGTSDTSAGAPLTTLAGEANAVPAVAEAAGRSMVELRITTGNGTVSQVGIAVAEGGLVVTTADFGTSAQSIDMVGGDGSAQQASLVGVDQGSDIALVSVPVGLPVAPFVDDVGLTSGTDDLTLSLVPAAGGVLALHCAPGSVSGVAAAIAAGSAQGMPSITSNLAASAAAASSSPTATPGEPLLNATGAVMGIRYGGGTGDGPATFLPTQLVVGVADDLRSNSKVQHGWLGLAGADAGGGAGADVASIEANSPAAAQHLKAGEVIVAVDGAPVRTMAELRARLYVLAPGTAVTLSVQETGAAHPVPVTVTLARSS